MLYREIIAVCSQIHTKHINTLCGQNVELLNANVNSLGHMEHVTDIIFTAHKGRYLDTIKRYHIYIYVKKRK